MSGQRRRRFHAIYLLPVLVWGGLVLERTHLQEIYDAAGSDRIVPVVRARQELADYCGWNPLRDWTSDRYLEAIERRLNRRTEKLADRLVLDVARSIDQEDEEWPRLARDCRYLMTVGGRPAAQARKAYDALFESAVEERLLEAVAAGRVQDPGEGYRLCQNALQAFTLPRQQDAVSKLRDRYQRQWDYAECQALVRYRADHPEDIDGFLEQLRQYLREHPRGYFQAAARHFIAWSSRLRGYRPYAVQLEEVRINEDTISNVDGAPEVYLTIQSGRRSTQCEPLPSGYHFRGVRRFDHGVRWRRGEPIQLEVWDSDQIQDDQLFEIRLHGDLALDQLNGKIVHRNGHWLRFRTSFEVPTFPAVPDPQTVTLDTSRR